jgi:hypothetical protein
MRPLHAERAWRSTQTVEQVWSTALDFDSYRSWWPFLVEFDPPRLQTGATARALVRAPAGYRLRLHLSLVDVDAPRIAVIDVAGDILGRCTVSFAPDGEGSTVGLAWSLAPDRHLLRILGVLARPILVQGHDWILDEGLRRCLDATGLDLRPLR